MTETRGDGPGKILPLPPPRFPIMTTDPGAAPEWPQPRAAIAH